MENQEEGVCFFVPRVIRRLHKPLPERSFQMIRSLLSVTVSAFVVCTLSTSADAAQVWVRSTNLGGGLTESFTYGSLAEMASNTGGQSLGVTNTINYQDGIWTDGNSVYKTTRTDLGANFNNAMVKYSSLYNLAANIGGETLLFNGRGMYFNEDVVARTGDGGGGTNWFFRSNGGDGFENAGNQDGFAANDGFTNMLNNSPFFTSGFAGGLQNGANKYWGNAGIDNSAACYNSVVVNGVVTAFRTYARGNDLFNNDPSSTLSSFAYSDSDRFLTIDSSMIPAPGAIALLAIAGVGVKRRRRA